MNKKGKCKTLVVNSYNNCPIIGSFCLTNLNAASINNLSRGTFFLNLDPKGHWMRSGWSYTRNALQGQRNSSPTVVVTHADTYPKK